MLNNRVTKRIRKNVVILLEAPKKERSASSDL
ncbi:hypothetical protein QBD01_000970 [Ochrobactrum sp. 19YEA23]|nr:hypothetical protein [Ochrobactrum sp. 19YEA23]